MKLRQQSIDTLNKLFAETAELSGMLRQFPAVKPGPKDSSGIRLDASTTHAAMVDGITQCQEAIIETLGIVQMVCRVMLWETGDIPPTTDLPGAKCVTISTGRNTFTDIRAVQIAAPDADRTTDAHQFDTAPAQLYAFASGEWPYAFLEDMVRSFLPAANFECRQLLTSQE